MKLPEPIGKPEMTLWFPRRKKAFRIIFSEPIPRIVHDFGGIAAGGLVERVELTELEMPNSELGQYEFAPLDDVRVTVYQPTTTARYLTKRAQGFVDKTTSGQFFVFEDNNVFMTAANPTGYDTNLSRVEFSGWRYQLEELPARPEKFTAVTTTGKPVA